MKSASLMFAIVLVSSTALAAEEPDVIEPGMKLKEVTSILKKHRYGFGRKYVRAMASRNPDEQLEFCSIDSNIDLIISYNADSGVVSSLTLHFSLNERIPLARRPELSRSARKIAFDGDGVYTVTLERVHQKPPPEPPVDPENPFNF